MKDIYTLKPINKTAAVVVGQRSCTSHDGLSLEQQKANLCAKWHELEKKIMHMHKKDPSRKVYGQKIHELHLQIIEINKQIKFKKFNDLSEYIIKVIKNRMTKMQWYQLLEEAEKERAAAGNCGKARTAGNM